MRSISGCACTAGSAPKPVPYEAIQVGGSYTNVVTNPNRLYKDKEDLIELANEYLEQHDWVYPNGQQAVQQTVHPEERRQHH